MIDCLNAAILLILSLITYQDFQRRLISVWCICVLAIILTFRTIILQSLMDVVLNVSFSAFYFSFLFVCIKLYFYLKTKSWQKVIDSTMGLGDVIVILIFGSTLLPENQIYFFTTVFVASVPIQIILFDKNKTAPLAAYMCIAYAINLIIVL